MFKKLDIRINIRNACIAALLFSVSVFLYIRKTAYVDTWLLYVGSFLFFVMIVIDVWIYNKRRGRNANTIAMMFSSHVTTLIGIVISCIFSFVILSLMVPGYLSNGPAGTVSPDTPVQGVTDKTNGLSWRIFIGATLMNFCFGSFAALMFPFVLRKNQTKDSGEPYPAHDRRTA